jgi:hypothetical protein
MGAFNTRNHYGKICGFKQGKVIRRITQRQNLNIEFVQVLLQHLQGLPFTNPRPQQMPHAVALHHGEVPLCN